MSRGHRKHKYLLIDEQIREGISKRLGGNNKASHLTAAVFALSFLALTLIVSVPSTFRKTAVAWALVHWIANLVWTVVASIGWPTPPDPKEFNHPSEQERIHDLRLQTVWFHLWKGGYLLLVATLVLLIGLGMLKHLVPARWVDNLAVSVYGLVYVFSFWQRRRICHTVLGGWSSDTRWGRLMLRLAVIGPVAGASTGSAVVIVLARLQIVPENFALGFFGILGIVLACMMVPQVVYDFLAAWVHLQVSRVEVEQTISQ